jgi:hypothetical protein
MKKLEDDLISDEAMYAPLYEIEEMLGNTGWELLRAMMQAHFDRRSAQEREVQVVDANGVERVRIRDGRRTVMTEFGEVFLDRKLYQADGDALAPLDGALDLPDEKYSLNATDRRRGSCTGVVRRSRRAGPEAKRRRGVKPRSLPCVPRAISTSSIAADCASPRTRRNSWY